MDWVFCPVQIQKPEVVTLRRFTQFLRREISPSQDLYVHSRKGGARQKYFSNSAQAVGLSDKLKMGLASTVILG
jgi:hypothetical protein